MDECLSCLPPQYLTETAFFPKNTGFAQGPYRRHLIRRHEKLPAPNKVVRLFHHGAASLCDTSGWLGGERTRKGRFGTI